MVQGQVRSPCKILSILSDALWSVKNFHVSLLLDIYETMIDRFGKSTLLEPVFLFWMAGVEIVQY